MNSLHPKCRLVYLDQFAASSIVDSKGAGVWGDIEGILRQGVIDGTLLCPIPAEHWMETAHRPLDTLVAQTSLFDSLSNGYHLLGAPFAAAKAMGARMRGGSMARYDYLEKVGRREVDQEIQQKLRVEREMLGVRLDPELKGANWIRSLARPGFIANKWKPFSFNFAEMMARKEFLDRLNTLIEEGGIVIRGAGFPEPDVPHWVDFLLDILMRSHRMTRAEAVRLRDEVQQVGFANIAPCHIRHTLVEHMAHKQKKETDGDHVDLLRMATALPMAHLALVDGPRKQELMETGLARKYGCQVFSGRAADLVEFSAALRLQKVCASQ